VTTTRATQISGARRWAILGASSFAQGAAAVTIHGPAFLIPVLHERRGLSLAQAGLVAAAPLAGVVITLVLWGFVVDHLGERFAMVAGLSTTAVAGLISTQVDSTVLLGGALFLAGSAAASTASASGGVVVGWFPPERRGLAMGIRQMAQPVGVGVSAVTIAVIADERGISTALWVPTVAALIGLVAAVVVIIDPPRPERTAHGPVRNPYVATGYLARIHGVSVLLVIPQFLVWTFALVWLTDDRGWSAGAAGTLVGLSQVAGALGRIAAGQLSDVVRSRLRPLRWVAVAAAVTMGGLGLAAHLDWGVAVALVVLATTVTVADNGLAFTAVAERAGPFWSGRALGVQNTAQYVAASAVPPIAGLVVAGWGYAAAFGLAALFPVLAIALVPVHQEESLT
jgi:sugar phosphate permease